MRSFVVLLFATLVTHQSAAQQPPLPSQQPPQVQTKPFQQQAAPTQLGQVAQPQQPAASQGNFQPPRPAIPQPSPVIAATPTPQQTPIATPAGTSEVTTVVASGDKNLYATLETSAGKIKVELFATLTPRTVRNFVELANGQKDFVDVKTGRPERRPFYDGLIFHKVLRGFAIFTGCPFGTGKGGPGYNFPDEITPSLRFSKPGAVAMANTGPNSNGSQFFITLSPQPTLDDKYTIFGQVIDGMSVVRKIENVKVGPTDRPLKRIYLKKITITE